MTREGHRLTRRGFLRTGSAATVAGAVLAVPRARAAGPPQGDPRPDVHSVR